MATKKRPKLTPLQAAWNKEIARLKKFQKRAERRGYIFAADFIPEKPKRITRKRLAELQARTARANYSKAQYLNPKTGEVVSGAEGRRIERSAAARKGVATTRRKKEEKERRRGDEANESAETLPKPTETAETSPKPTETAETPAQPEPPGAPDDAEGHFHVIEQIIQLFGGIPEVKYGGRYQNLIDLEAGREMCVELLLNEWDERTGKGEGAAYAGYLRAIEGALAREINEIIYDDSDQDTVNGHYNFIASLIKASNLDMQEMQEIEAAYEGTEDEDYY